MNTSTLWLVSLVIWTSLMAPLPLSNASASDPEALVVSASASEAAVPAVPPTPANSANPPQADNTISSPSFTDAANQWIKVISEKQGYQSWKQATWTSQPLGPGTHGWIVLLKSGGQSVGYMVIHAADPANPAKYRLTEYGNGSAPLFSMQTLYQSLVQLELIDSSYQAERLYAGPLQAVWKVTAGDRQYFIDAKTGEVLPQQVEADLKKLYEPAVESALPTTSPELTISASVQLPEFDPYEKLPWVKGTPEPYESPQALLSDLEQQAKLTYTAQLYNDEVTMPLAVTGYHQWSNDDLFLLLEQNGQRAVPFGTAFKLGRLYR